MAEIVEPSSVHPHEIVENVYLASGQVAGAEPLAEDHTSQLGMEDFLQSRLVPDAQPTPGGILQIPVGEEEYTTALPRLEGWKFWLSETNEPGQHWRRAAAIFLGANALLNLVNGNVVSFGRDSVEAVQSVKDTVEDHFHIGEVTDRRTVVDQVPTTRTRTVNETLEFNSSGEAQPVGEAVVDQQVVDKILDSVERHNRDGSRLVSASFNGVASDDWRSDVNSHGLHHANSQNEKIAQQRLDITKAKLLEDAASRGIDLSKATFSSHEAVLSEEDALAVENAVLSNGFDTYDSVDDAVDAALAIYNKDPQSLPETLQHVLHERLPRGFVASLTYQVTEQVPGRTRTETRHIVEKHPDGRPENKDNDYDWALLPLILAPLPELRRQIRKRIHTEEVVIPPSVPDPEYLKLYPVAKTEEDKLVDEAWAYSRKFQHLLRETDRIQGMYRLDYVDGEGVPQRLRAMFVDHEPTPDTRERVASLLQTISQMQDGRVGRELDMIAIYPSENAGTQHNDPKRIAIGQDIQFDDATLGLAVPALKLVEMHMPPASTLEDMGSHNSPDWVLAHEIGGHFTDLNKDDNELTELMTLANGTIVYLTNGRFENALQANYNAAAAEEASGAPSRWRVHRQIVNKRGEVIDLHHDVVDPTQKLSRSRVINAVRRGIRAIRNEHEMVMTTGDPRLAESILVQKETGHPTRYGATNPAEHYAEAAASELVGAIPFSEAHDGQHIATRPVEEGFVTGYNVASRDRQAIMKRWGADDSREEGVVFTDANGEPVKRPDWRHWYGKPADDDELAKLMNEARTTPLPYEQDLLHIITGTRIAD